MLKYGSWTVNYVYENRDIQTTLDLRQNHFQAILDVYEVEPLPMDSPLRGLENTILIPHQGGPTIDRRAVAARLVIEDIRNLSEGLPLKNEIVASRAVMMSTN